jgi:hypothetical protein
MEPVGCKRLLARLSCWVTSTCNRPPKPALLLLYWCASNPKVCMSCLSVSHLPFEREVFVSLPPDIQGVPSCLKPTLYFLQAENSPSRVRTPCRPNPLRQVFFKRILAHPPGRPAVELSLFVPSPDYYLSIPPAHREPDFDAVYKAAAAQQHLPQSQSPWAIVPSVLRMVADQVDAALRDAKSSSREQPHRRVEDEYQQQQPAKDTKSSRLPASPSPSPSPSSPTP